MEREDEERVRLIVQTEITARINPWAATISGLVKKLGELQVSQERMSSLQDRVWNDGSDGPLGYLNVARAEDLIRETKRDNQVKEILEEVGKLKDAKIRDDSKDETVEKNEELDRRRKKMGSDKIVMICGIVVLIFGFLELLLALGMKIKFVNIDPPGIFRGETPSLAISLHQQQDASSPPPE